MAAEKVKRPGSRGGHGYYNEQGEWVYGVRPFTESAPTGRDDILRWGVSAYHHLGLTGVPAYDGPEMDRAGEEWRRRYPRFYFPHRFVLEGIERAHKARAIGHDDLGYQTSEELRTHIASIAALGYQVDDRTATQPLTLRLKTWGAINEHCTTLATILPGLPALLAASPLILRVMKATSLGSRSTLAKFKQSYSDAPPAIEISPKHSDSLMHEMGHYLDNALSGSQYSFASTTATSPLSILVREAKEADTYKEFAKDIIGQEYHNANVEVFARLFESWVIYKTSPPGSIDKFHYGEFTRADIERFDAGLEPFMRDRGLIKSLQRMVLLKAQHVEHPGSRGGHGYYNDEGNWEYGIRPFATVAPQTRKEARRFGVSAYHHLGHQPTRTELEALHRERYSRPFASGLDEHAATGGYLAADAISENIAHDDTGQPTSELLRMAQRVIEGYGYRISPNTGFLAEQERANLRVAEALREVHELLPGLADLNRRTGIVIRIESVSALGIDIRGEYTRPDNGLGGMLSVSASYPETMVHELGHYIDNCIAMFSLNDAWGHRHLATQDMAHHPLAKLTEQLKTSPSYQAWIKTVPGNATYWRRNSEVFARFFDTWVARSHHHDPSDTYEPYTDEEMSRFGAALESILRGEGLVKSLFLLRTALRKSAAANVVLHPGVRGGKGYWNSHGRWQYGLRPIAHGHPRPHESESDYPALHLDGGVVHTAIEQVLAERNVRPDHYGDALMHLGASALPILIRDVQRLTRASGAEIEEAIIALRESLRPSGATPTPGPETIYPEMPKDHSLFGIKIGTKGRRPISRFDIQTALIYWDNTPQELRQWGRSWYPDRAAWIQELSDRSGYSEDQVAAVVALMSPQTMWEKEQGRHSQSYDNIHLAEWAVLDGIYAHMYRTNNEKVARVLEYKGRPVDPERDLGAVAFKVKSFYHNLRGLGEGRYCTIDRHMFNMFGVLAVNANNFERYRRTMAEAARLVGERPESMQAATWEQYRRSQMTMRDLTNRARTYSATHPQGQPAWQRYVREVDPLAGALADHDNRERMRKEEASRARKAAKRAAQTHKSFGLRAYLRRHRGGLA